jgi:hypothetical protein
VNVTSIGSRFDADGRLLDESFLPRIEKFLDELLWMAATLRHGRDSIPLGSAT